MKLSLQLMQLVILKSWKVTHDQQKISSNLLPNPNGAFLTLEAQKTWKIRNVKKNKNGKNRQKSHNSWF